MPRASICGANGQVIDNVMGASSFTQAWVSGREAVAITVRPVNTRAIWMAIEPTPPAPPMMRMALAAPGTPGPAP